MMLINLFLRPSLMIMGFLAAIMVTWLSIDLVNLAFYSAVKFGGVTPDPIAGPFVVGLTYTGILVALVTKVFALVNQVPDKILRWIGDNTTAMGGAEAELQGGKQGAQEAASQAGKTAGEYGNTATQPLTQATTEAGNEISIDKGWKSSAAGPGGAPSQAESSRESIKKNLGPRNRGG